MSDVKLTLKTNVFEVLTIRQVQTNLVLTTGLSQILKFPVDKTYNVEILVVRKSIDLQEFVIYFCVKSQGQISCPLFNKS